MVSWPVESARQCDCEPRQLIRASDTCEVFEKCEKVRICVALLSFSTCCRQLFHKARNQIKRQSPSSPLNPSVFTVIATMRDLRKKDNLVEAAGDTFGKTMVLLPLDVCSDESVKQCVNNVKDRHIDILSK